MKPRKPHTPRSPQLALRFDAELPDPAARWRDGALLPYLGGQLTLRIETDRKTAQLEDAILHLPLPPGATPRQIQDGVEAWLRQEAARLIGACVEQQALHAVPARPVPNWSFSFAARGGWAQQHEDGSLRFNWRLIEQPRETIEQVVAASVAALPVPGATADLWGMQRA